jgi:hypothetical protein
MLLPDEKPVIEAEGSVGRGVTSLKTQLGIKNQKVRFLQ